MIILCMINYFHLNQGNCSVAGYALHFCRLTVASGWNEAALITAHCQGLSPSLQLQLAIYGDAMGL